MTTQCRTVIRIRPIIRLASDSAITMVRFRPSKAYNSENSRRLWLFPGSVRGFPRKTPGKSQENCWKILPESQTATNSRISGTGKGKPVGNLGSTQPGSCPQPSVQGVL